MDVGDANVEITVQTNRLLLSKARPMS